MIYAPVLIPTLNRYEHFKRCIMSLAGCTHAKDTDLYIALDYPLTEEHWEGYRAIKEYLKDLYGFKSLNIIERGLNYGVQKNYQDSSEELFERYDRIIVTEDDNEFSPNFLEYINYGLERYKDDPRIIAICGHGGVYGKPDGYGSNYYYLKGFSAWGYGTWKDRLGILEYTSEELKALLMNKGLCEKLKFFYERHYYAVLSYIEGEKTMYGDGAIAINMILQETYCVYPTVSKVRNHGHDGSGVHGGNLIDSPFAKETIDTAEHFDFEGTPIFDDPGYLELQRNYTKVQVWWKAKFWIRKAQKPRKLLDLLRVLHFCRFGHFI